nr:hypothetical protein HK105_003011 [Polyrhizophydium stewartii]
MFVAAITLALATAAAAAPAPRADVERRSISKLPFHFPTSHTETVPSSGRSHLGAVSETKAVSIATDFLTGKLGLAAGEFQAESHFTDHRGIVHVYGAQFKNGVRIANHQAAAHVKNGEVVTFSSSFGATSQFTKPKVPAATAKLTGEQAAAKAAASVGIPYFKDFGTAAEYVNTGSGVVYAYKLQLRNLAKAEWVQVWADANTGEVVQAIDFTNKASYKAIPLPKINPNDGFTLISNPEDATASSAGWLDASGTSKGNNAIAAKLDANYNPVTFASATSADVFDSAFDANADPSTAANLRAATINLFYLTNMIHDISRR